MTDIDNLLEQLKQKNYQGDTDIVSSVMQRIDKLPRPIPVWQQWGRRIAISAAAAVALAVSVNLVLFFNKDYNEPQLCDMFASVYDFNAYDTADDDADMLYLSLLAMNE